MFFFNLTRVLCGYEEEDNVIGIPSTVDTFTLEDATLIKSLLLSYGEQVINVTYDPGKLDDEIIIELVEREMERFILPKVEHPAGDLYTSCLLLPVNGKFLLENESEQAMTALSMNVVTNILTSRYGNNYFANYSNTSLTDLIREKNGLTYGIQLYDNQIAYGTYTMFGCDVTKGTEELMMTLFKESINKSVDGFTEEVHDALMKTYELKRTLSNVNQESYGNLHNLAMWYPSIIEKHEVMLALDVDRAYSDFEGVEGSYGKMRNYLENVCNAVNTESYGLVTNV